MANPLLISPEGLSTAVYGDFRYFGHQPLEQTPWQETQNGYRTSVSYSDFCRGTVTLTTYPDAAILSVDLECEQLPYVFSQTFSPQKSLTLDVQLPPVQAALSRYSESPFWTRMSFEKDLSKVREQIQNMLLQFDDVCLSVLPLCNKSFSAMLAPSDAPQTLRICLDKLYEGAASLHGAAAVFSWNTDPYEAVRQGFALAKKENLIQTELRETKKLPDMYKGLGWCTWNAFYHEVSQQGILEKLQEFREKHIPAKWVMIDDGWAQRTGNNDFQITSFTEDRKKFPDGLKGCIRKMKEIYGVEAVGVWHALTGHWYGVAEPLATQQRENLQQTNAGWMIPGGQSPYQFFHQWHTYLKEQGVDFVKIDSQGNALEFLLGKKDCLEKAMQIQLDADRSVAEVFGGNVINCMGMNNINVFNRPYSALARNSDDFFPNKESSFAAHLPQNVYNAVFQGCLFYCDFDMWWTNHESAKVSSVLRAVSGGPVYISDKVGQTNPDALRPFLQEDGSITICDGPALPTADCLFRDTTHGVLKLFNRLGNDGVVAVFNLSEEAQTVAVGTKDFKGNGSYAASCHYSGVTSECGTVEIQLAPGDAELIYFSRQNRFPSPGKFFPHC